MSTGSTVQNVMDGDLSPLRAGRQLRLLKAAETVFLRDGYHAATMEHVAAEAGVAKQTLYNYFPDKQCLLATLLAHWKEESGFAALAAALAALGDGRGYEEQVAAVEEALRSTFRAKQSLDAAALFRLLVEVNQELPNLSAPLCATLEPHGVEGLRRALEAGVAAGRLRPVDTQAIATLVFDLLAGYRTVQPLVLREPEQVPSDERLSRCLAEMLVRTLVEQH